MYVCPKENWQKEAVHIYENTEHCKLIGIDSVTGEVLNKIQFAYVLVMWLIV